MSEIVDPDDPAAVREAYAVETTWDEEAEVYRVTAGNTTTESHVMGIISNRGDWESAEVYTDYVNTLLGIQGTEEEWSGPGQCEVAPPVLMSFSGDYARWDQETSEWAENQRSNLLLDAVSGPNWKFNPDGRNVDLGITTEKCAESSNDELTNVQCSTVLNETSSEDPGPCEPDPQGERSLVSQARTYIKEFSWEGDTTELKSDGTIAKLNAVWIDEANLGAYYYDSDGEKERRLTRSLSPVPSDYASKPVGTQINTTHTFGTCGYGFVEKNKKKTPKLKTRAGTGANPCPEAP